MNTILRKRLALTALGFAVAPTAAFAAPQNILEETIVTARQRAETLMDVPVSAAVFSDAELQRYNITNLNDLAKMVPNFQINQSGSGNGAELFLRGVGSSSISAGFDSSVALNIDGVVVNRGRFIFNSYLDMKQIEVLKGPQSLYFGKSATAAVVSVTTNDPGDELEVDVMAGYEFEHEQTMAELVVSGPITDTFGARLAIGGSLGDKMIENLNQEAKVHWRHEDTANARLTLVWDPTDTIRAKLKVNYAEFENDGGKSNFDVICADGVRQDTRVLGQPLPNIYEDCKVNGNTSVGDIPLTSAVGLPFGADDGVPFNEMESWLNSLQVDWDINDTYTLTSVTGLTLLDQKEMDNYSASDSGYYMGLPNNKYDSFTQEFRLSSDYDGMFNFQAGVYYQDTEQIFDTQQTALNFTFLFPADIATGNGFDWSKKHTTDSTTYSAFLATYWDVTDAIEITAGARYTEEEKDGRIDIEYVHFAADILVPGGFLHSGDTVTGLKFEDDNISPEFAVNWTINDEVAVYGAYKKGFKSGGIDTSALPGASLNPSNPAFPDFLIFDSEEAEGFELGLKAELLEGSLRVNATAFTYDYDDLQVQQFDATAIQFSTYNASMLRTTGLEFDLLWYTPIEGLSLRGAFAYTDAEFAEEFINVDEFLSKFGICIGESTSK